MICGAVRTGKIDLRTGRGSLPPQALPHQRPGFAHPCVEVGACRVPKESCAAEVTTIGSQPPAVTAVEGAAPARPNGRLSIGRGGSGHRRVVPDLCRFGHENWDIVGNGKTGPVRRCRTCKENASRRRTSGITPEQYHDFRNAQAGCCALCLKMTYMLCADHNHKTGFIRGLLCVPCNRGLGLLKDSPRILQRAALFAAKGN